MEMNDVEKKISLLEQRIKKIEDCLLVNSSNDIINNADKESKKMSIKEFLILKNPGDDAKRTLAIAYFLEHYDGIMFFNADDIKTGFTRAKIKKPSNTNDKINLNIKNGHIMNSDEKKESKKTWQLTASGEKFVENNFLK